MYRFSANDYFIEKLQILNATEEKKYNFDTANKEIDIFIRRKLVSASK